MAKLYPKIALQGEEGLFFIRKDEVVAAFAKGNYTIICLIGNRKFKVLRKLKEVNELLGDDNFLRIHRSHLVNLSHVVRLVENQKEIVLMSDGSELSVARNRKSDLIDRFTRI